MQSWLRLLSMQQCHSRLRIILPTCGDEYTARSRVGHAPTQHDSIAQDEPIAHRQDEPTAQHDLTRQLYDSTFDSSIIRTEIEDAEVKDCGVHIPRDRKAQDWSWKL